MYETVDIKSPSTIWPAAVVKVVSLLFPVDEFCRIKFFPSLNMPEKSCGTLKKNKKFHDFMQDKTVP